MFKTFPQFSKLTLADGEEYEAFIKDFPPLGDITFASMMTWWAQFGGLAVARLNGNLVISYWLPGDDDHSGLSLIGTCSVDESICEIFDYQRERGEKPRLVNVPDFVVNSLQYPDLFSFRAGRDEDEYLLLLSKFAALEKMPPYMRFRARRFIREIGQQNIKVRPLDLSSAANRQFLLDLAAEWPLKGINDINKLEREVLPVSINSAVELGLRVVCLYIEEDLQAYCTYLPTHDPEHIIISHARANYNIPRIFDFMTHSFCHYWAEKGYRYLNIHADNGSQKLRVLKIALKPENFFRKYTIEAIKK